MANTVNQVSKNPTNKLSTAIVAAAAISVASLVIKNLFPEWYDPQTIASVTPVIIGIAGWLVPDAPNVVVITTDSEQ